MRNWTVFEGKANRSRPGEPRVTINRFKDILLNAAAYSRLGEPGHVELLFDRRYSVIGIRPADRDKHTFEVLPKMNSQYQIVHATRFCNYFDLRFTKTELFTEPVLNADGTLELDLTKTQTVNRGG